MQLDHLEPGTLTLRWRGGGSGVAESRTCGGAPAAAAGNAAHDLARSLAPSTPRARSGAARDPGRIRADSGPDAGTSVASRDRGSQDATPGRTRAGVARPAATPCAHCDGAAGLMGGAAPQRAGGALPARVDAFIGARSGTGGTLKL